MWLRIYVCGTRRGGVQEGKERCLMHLMFSLRRNTYTVPDEQDLLTRLCWLYSVQFLPF